MNRSAIFPVLLVASAPAFANDAEPRMREYLETEISAWAANPVLIEAIRNQNTATQGYSQAQIDEMDQAWRKEVGMTDSAVIGPVLQNAASDYLRGVVADAGGVITEVFVMDARGLNVAASDVTSDYWQGDEQKFTETFQVGAEGVHFGEIEFDESSQTYQGQISFSVVDPETSAPVGAMTVGVNAESFF
jgi:hypothetical protein